MTRALDPKGAETDPLDPFQRAVVEARDGVVLVTGAPGTGKTTAAVEVVLDRVRRGVAADRCVVLAPTRLAAARLRAEITGRLGRTTTEPLARTAAAFAFAVLREAAVVQGSPPPRLLTGAEQDVVLGDLLAGHASGQVRGPAWPSGLSQALATRGFRDQLRDLLMRAVEHGVGPSELADLGSRLDRPEWLAAADVLREYDEVTALSRPGAFDPAWICAAAADLLHEDREALARLHRRVQLIVVDDAQELTASAARLLHAMHHPGMPVVLVGDGDVSAQGFRGADPARFGSLAQRLAGPAGPTAVVLRHHHRLHQATATAAARVVARLGAASGVEHRRAEARPAPEGVGATEVHTLRSPGDEASLVAARFRREHLHSGCPWSQMAVIARSRPRLDLVRRRLVAAGIPVIEPALTGPLRDQPPVRVLLLAYEVALRQLAPGAALVSATEVVDLLTSPLGGADPVAMSRLRRLVRATCGPTGDRATDDLLAELAADEPALRLLDPDAEPLQRVAAVLAAGRSAAQARGADRREATAESVLWALWSASGLAEDWREQALAGGVRGARADRDLDAVMLLFAAAADYAHRLPGHGPAGFPQHVAAHDVTPDSLVPRARPVEAVELLTPQGAAGRQWRHVAVVGVQEGVWPDLRLRDTLLGSEVLVAAVNGQPVAGAEGVRAASAAVRADETRLFYLAVTRASHSVVVSAVASVDEQPSAFLDLLDPREEPREPIDPPPQPTLRGLVGELRRDVVARHRVGDQPGRDRAARHLLRLAAEGVAGADPKAWWSARTLSDSSPLRAQRPVTVSPSRVQAFTECALRWLLVSRGGEAAGATPAAVGTLVHDVISAAPEADVDQLQRALDDRWPELQLGQGWLAERERDRAKDMLRRYTAYLASARAEGRTLLAVEQEVDVVVGDARIKGRVDRLERSPRGLVVVDLKTGASKPTNDRVDRHPQLGVYQVAVQEGMGQGLVGSSGQVAALGSGGAALVHLGRASGAKVSVQTQRPLRDDPDPRWAHQLVAATAHGMAGAQFPASVGAWCRTCPVRQCCPAQPEGAAL